MAAHRIVRSTQPAWRLLRFPSPATPSRPFMVYPLVAKRKLCSGSKRQTSGESEATRRGPGKGESDKSVGNVDEDGDEPCPPRFGLPDPHEGKPDKIIDDDGVIRYLCLDGNYRRGDPDSIECKPENFSEWLTEWVVAARTGKLDDVPQKTFLPEENRESNPKGKFNMAGTPMRSEEVLVKGLGRDGKPVWEVKDPKHKYIETDSE